MKKRGFTLIELLVVIAIIGILATVILVSVNGGKEKANDAKEISHLKQIQAALEVYYATNGRYFPAPILGDPSPTCGKDNPRIYSGVSVCANCSVSGPNDFLKFLVNDGFLSTAAVLEMFGGSSGFLKTCYFRSPDGLRYKFVSILNSTKKMSADGGINSNFYEVFNDKSIPFNTNTNLYK